MSNFKNIDYENRAKNWMNDMFYANTSYEGKISTARRYAEVVVRKILDIDPTEKMTLGWGSINNRIKELPNHEYLESALSVIKSYGDDSAHTEHLEDFSEVEFSKVEDSLNAILAFPLINYFDKYGFGTQPHVVYSFSLLPPIIRYKVLSYLHSKYPDHLLIIEKLVLATMKAYGKEAAEEWIEENKETLLSMADEECKCLAQIRSTLIDSPLASSIPRNMYEKCKRKIADLAPTIQEQGLKYSSFEEALPFYKEHGILNSDDPIIVEFNDIMNFLYLGRAEDISKMESSPTPLIIMNYLPRA